MRTLSNSAMEIEYPDDMVFSGDLNRIKVTKNTTASHFEISFTIDGFTYNENLYFLSNSITFSLSEILNLIFSRNENSMFSTIEGIYFTIKLYNNTSVIDEQTISIDSVILGKRRVFDKIGNIVNIDSYDYDIDIGMVNVYYYFNSSSALYAKLSDGSNEYVGVFTGLSQIDVSSVSGAVDYFFYSINILKNGIFKYLSGPGSNSWSNDDYPGCDSSFGITALNKLQLVIPDVSCQDTFSIQYTDGLFTPGKTYKTMIVVDNVNNPSSSSQFIQFNMGGNTGVQNSGTGTFVEYIVCGPSGVLELVAYFDADTSGFGTHSFSATFISVSEVDEVFYINESCEFQEKKIGLRFKNRFGCWRNYFVIKKTENVNSSSGISLFYLENNDTELNSIFSEQKKGYGHSITVYRDSLTKEKANDISDIVYSDYVHVFDDVNGNWVPVKVATNSFSISEKENLFDITLNLILQSDNE